jgi:hypothetical protein
MGAALVVRTVCLISMQNVLELRLSGKNGIVRSRGGQITVGKDDRRSSCSDCMSE